jgi:hypothetical protein
LNRTRRFALFSWGTHTTVAALLLLPLAAAEAFATVIPAENNAHFVDVTQGDGVYVVEAIASTDDFSPAAARVNSERIHAILTNKNIGEQCLIYFPPGRYYFDGAADDWRATIETTARSQTIAGAGMNATRILQASRDVPATIRLRHDQAAIRDLFIGSADTDAAFRLEWEEAPHQTAIHIDAPAEANPWSASPRVERVAINSYGNSILQKQFSRPFKEGIRITGAWLDVYIRQIWMTDIFTGVYVDQGAVMAGPAKIMEVNHYSTHDRDGASHAWTTFFKSETNFMEQVELLDCMFIGAQFVYMDGQPREQGSSNTPVFNMVISGNYINVHDVGNAPEALEPDARWSGLYFNLPARRREGAPPDYSRDIRFVDNSCTGRAPRDGAFFYVEGMLRGLTLSGNDVSSGGADRCIQIRATEELSEPDGDTGDNVAIRDIKITANYFRNYRNIITTGSGFGDSMRNGVDRPASDLYQVQRLIFAHNQSMMEGPTEATQLTAGYFARVRQLVIDGNTLAPTPSVALAVNDSEDVTVRGNALVGTGTEQSRGIILTNVKSAAVANNTLRGFNSGIDIRGGKGIVVMGNALTECPNPVTADESTQYQSIGNSVE